MRESALSESETQSTKVLVRKQPIAFLLANVAGAILYVFAASRAVGQSHRNGQRA